MKDEGWGLIQRYLDQDLQSHDGLRAALDEMVKKDPDGLAAKTEFEEAGYVEHG